MTGSVQNCNVACSNSTIANCVSGDGCCPAGCTSASDSDCSGGTGGAGTGGQGTGGEGVGGGTGGIGTGGMTCSENDIPDSPNTLGVDVTTAEHVVSKEIFGLLMETLGNDVTNGVWVGTNSIIPNTAGVRDDIIEGMREAGVGAMEWPGGCAANDFDWEAKLSPSNTMGVDRFMDFALETGAEPVLVGRPSTEYADSNRQWIEYVNNSSSHPEWNVKYFKIGNEVWGCGAILVTSRRAKRRTRTGTTRTGTSSATRTCSSSEPPPGSGPSIPAMTTTGSI